MEKTCENCRHGEMVHTDAFPCKPCTAHTENPYSQWKLKNDDDFIMSLVDRIEFLENLIIE
jgi:hypothetical protein